MYTHPHTHNMKKSPPGFIPELKAEDSKVTNREHFISNLMKKLPFSHRIDFQSMLSGSVLWSWLRDGRAAAEKGYHGVYDEDVVLDTGQPPF